MATNFPSGLDSFTNPTATDAMDSVTVPHADQHADVNDAVEALQAKVGVDGSAVTSSLDYQVANQGLTLVKSQTISSTPSTSVTVSNAFSSTFDNYKVIVSGMDTNVSNYSVEFQFDGSTSNYYWAGWQQNYSGTAGGFISQTSDTKVPVGYTTTTESTVCEFTVFDPYDSAKRSRVSVMPSPGNDYVICLACEHAQVASYTGFKLNLYSPGTMSGGTIRVYGYNNG